MEPNDPDEPEAVTTGEGLFMFLYGTNRWPVDTPYMMWASLIDTLDQPLDSILVAVSSDLDGPLDTMLNEDDVVEFRLTLRTPGNHTLKAEVIYPEGSTATAFHPVSTLPLADPIEITRIDREDCGYRVHFTPVGPEVDFGYYQFAGRGSAFTEWTVQTSDDRSTASFFDTVAD